MAVDARTPASEVRKGTRRSVPALILLSLFIVGSLVMVACFAGWIAPYDYAAIDLRARLAPPAWYPKGSVAHVLGTDELGRDVLSRLIYSIRTSLVVALLGCIISAVLGTCLGFLSAHFRGWVDEVV